MASWRAYVERFLPWFDPIRERRRNAKTERVVQQATDARNRAERVIAAYRVAEKASDRADVAADEAAEAVIDEVQRQ